MAENQTIKQKIATLKEKLVTKNMLYRSLKSRVDMPEYIDGRIKKYQEEITRLYRLIQAMRDTLLCGDDDLICMLVDIERLEDSLRILEAEKDIAKYTKLVEKLVEQGILDSNGNIVVPIAAKE